MKLTSIQKLVLLLLALFVVAVLFIVFAIIPKFGELDAMQAERAAAQAQVDEANRILSQLEEAKARSVATEAEMLKLDTQMPESPQLPTLIIELQNIANSAGVSVLSFAPSQPAASTTGQYSEIAMSLQVTSTWDDLLDYLKRLNKATRVMRTTSISIAPMATDTTANLGANLPLQTTLNVKAYTMGVNGVVMSAPTTTTP